ANHPELAQPAAADRIVPWFVVRQLPAGIAGVVIAGVFAAAMSSLDSSMNSVATAYVSDFHRRFSAAATDAQCLTIAKIVTVAVGVAGTGIALWMAQVDIQYLFDYFNTLLGLVGGSLTGVFLLAALTRRGSSAGALVGWAVGAAATIATALCTDVTFYLYAAIGCLTCLAVGYGVSLLQPDAKSVAGLHIHDLKKKAHA
ncbi:MAG: sodium:solute symporter, partial [Planctomycetales bacterium]|nr:sodium:solute symporter [Planctomycetales bacterium]